MQPPIIEACDIVKTFRVGNADVPVLDLLSFSIQAGEFVGIVGPSGNGKSTLLNMITGIDRPTAGELRVNGRPIHRMSEDQLAAWRSTDVGIVFQFFQLLPALSLRKNIILPMDIAGKYTPRERRERAMDLLTLVGLADQADKLPSMVSGGQQQRAAIARALAYCETLVETPQRTIVILVTDFYEGGRSEHLIAMVKKLREAGVILLGLAALDQQARPAYDQKMAERVVAAGAEVAALTPLQLAEWLMGVIR